MGYRGEVMAKFRNTTDVIPAVYKDGERFAQLLILPVPDVTFTEVEELSETERGENGYGSTNKDEESAPTGSTGYPEQKSELTDQKTEPDGSGGAENSPEQAQ